MLAAMTSPRGIRRFGPVAVAISTLLVLPGIAAAHAELVRTIPTDGAAVTEPVTFVSGRYTEDMTADSSLLILDSSGATIGTGGVDPNDDRVMIARPDAPLTSGTFTVRSTAISQVDGHPERETWTFTVAVAETPSPTDSPSDGPGVSATPEPTPESSPSTAPTASPTPSPAPGESTSSTTDVLLPIVAALAFVLVLAGFLLNRSRAGR